MGLQKRLRSCVGARAITCVFGLIMAGTSSLAAAGLVNGGFENGLSPWEPVSTANDILVVGSEGCEFDVYGPCGPNETTIDPVLGLNMLRLGTPESPGDQNNNQNNGLTAVSQSFTASTTKLQLATRIWSTEFRNNRDAVSIRLFNGAGQELSLPVAGLQSCSATGCTIKLDAGRNGDILDSGWQIFRIGDASSGLVIDQQYTLRYELTTGGGDSHPSWIYFDNVNTPPLANAGPDAEGFVGVPVMLDGSASSDGDGDPLTYSWTLTSIPPGSTATLDDATLVQPSFTPDLLGDYTAQLIVNDGNGDSAPDEVTITVVNRPPVAAFTCNPGGASGTVVLEGDFIGCDATTSTDPDGDTIVTYVWTVSSIQLQETITLFGPVAGFYVPQNGSYDIELLVSDGIDTGSASNQGSSGLVTAPSSVGNAPPLVSALDVETLGQATLRCRGVDPGAADTHTVTLAVGSDSASASVLEENDPAYATFVASRDFDATDAGLAPGSYPGSCVANDSGGDQGSDNFTLTVLDPAVLFPPEGMPGRFEPNESSMFAEPRDAGTTFLARLESTTDVDFYELQMEDGTLPMTGAEFLVRAKMPADYDLVLLSRPAGGVQTTVFESAPFITFPFITFPFITFEQETAPFITFPFITFPKQTAPFITFPFITFPFITFPFETSPFITFPLTVADYPLSQMVDAPRGLDSAGDQVAFGELGSLNLSSFEQDNLRVKDVSANFNTPDAPYETVFGVKTADEEAIYLAVLSYDGVLSPDAYEVTVEASRPLDTAAFLDSNCPVESPSCNCTGTPLVAPAPGEAIREGLTPTVLVVTQRQRLQANEGLDNTGWTTFVGAITPWMNAVDARFVSVPSDLAGEDAEGNLIDAFGNWDTQPCDIASLKPLTDALGQHVRDELTAHPSIKSVIVLGDFDTFPAGGEQDFTQIGNEALFLRDLPVRPETSIAAVFRAGQFLSDSCLTDADPITFNGGLFCVEDFPTGRLVSTTRMQEEAVAYAANGGIITYENGLVSGYEFFLDVAGSMSASLNNLGGSLVSLNNETWLANDPNNPLNSLEPQWCAVNPDASGVQGHASPNAILSAGGFNAGDLSDVTTVDECAGTPTSLTASIGCHMLTPVPQNSTLPVQFFPADPSLTWADRPGTFVGTPAFGLGHTDHDSLGTEGILKRFFACIGDNAAAEQPLSVGECVIRSKVEYLQFRTSFDAYDVKSLMTLGISGIPDVTIVPSEAQASALAGESAASDCSDGTPFDLTVEDGGATVSQHCLRLVNDPPLGSYYTIDDQYQAGTGRPLLPTHQVSKGPVPPNPTAARSMALKQGNYELILGFNPVVANLETEWDEVAESKSCVSTMAPTELGVFIQLPVNGQLQEAFNLTTAQFECTLAPIDQGLEDTVGNLRKFDSLNVEAKRPPLALVNDVNPPDVTLRDIIANATTGDALAVVNATDENGMAEINVIVYTEDRLNGGPGQAQAYSCPGPNCVVNNLNQPEASEIFLPGAAGKFVAIEYFDNAFNKILKSGKGILVEAVQVVINASTVTVGELTQISVEVERVQEFLDRGLTLTIDYSDQPESEVFVLNADTPECSATITNNCITILTDGVCELDGTCTGVFETSHVFAPGGALYTVTATIRGPASGFDEAVVSPCEDIIGDQPLADGDLTSCGFSNTGTDVDIDLYVRGVISDEFKYRVKLLGKQFQYSKNKLSRPPGVQASVTLLGDPQNPNGLRISFDADDIGWDGEAALTIEQSTQDGIAGGQSQGTTDEHTFTVTQGEPGI